MDKLKAKYQDMKTKLLKLENERDRDKKDYINLLKLKESYWGKYIKYKKIRKHNGNLEESIMNLE